MIEVVTALGLVLGPTGAAWLSVKHSLNGTAKRVKRIERKMTILRREQTEIKATLQEHMEEHS
jgi:hypothetical protein